MIEITKSDLILLFLIAFACGMLLVMSIHLATRFDEVAKRLKDLANRMKKVR